MNDEEFRSWLRRGGHTEATEVVIRRIRGSGPSRRVQGGFSNVTGRFPSRKMGFTIQFDSHEVELPFIREYEYSDEVLEYYDQPEPVKLSYRTVNGRPVTTLSTPDFFVLRADGTAGWEECKPEDDLSKLAAKTTRFANFDGTWTCPPGSDYASRHGLYFRVRSSSEINWIYQRNLNFLDDYLRDTNPPPIPQKVASMVTAIISGRQGLPLSNLFLQADGISRDQIHYLIASGAIFVDITSHLLTEPDRVPVFTDALNGSVLASTSARRDVQQSQEVINFSVGGEVVWDGNRFEVVNVAGGHVWLKNPEGKVCDIMSAEIHSLVRQGHMVSTPDGKNPDVPSLLMNKNPAALAIANARYAIIEPFLAKSGEGRPGRSIYRWIKAFREAEALYGNGYYGLIPNTSKRGNRSSKLPQESFDLIQKCIDEKHLTLEAPTIISTYGFYLNYCESANVIAASLKTFSEEIKRRQADEVARKRQGKRAAYKYEILYWRLAQTTPRHGERPFEIVHIDHTELDIQLVHSSTRKSLGRPWLSLMIDAWSRRILAYSLSFEHPSYRSCQLVLRDCVQRCNRLPQTIVVDNGKEFKSFYFESLMPPTR